MDEKEARDRIATAFKGLLIRVRNETPPEWGAVIVAATATFAYSNNTRSDDTKSPLQVRSGEYFYLQSQDLCVSEHLVALRVEVDGNTQVIAKTYPGNPGKCQIRNEIVLAPALVSQDEGSTKSELSSREVSIR